MRIAPINSAVADRVHRNGPARDPRRDVIVQAQYLRFIVFPGGDAEEPRRLDRASACGIDSCQDVKDSHYTPTNDGTCPDRRRAEVTRSCVRLRYHSIPQRAIQLRNTGTLTIAVSQFTSPVTARTM